MITPQIKLAVVSIADSLAALTANQAMIIELLHDKLPLLSDTEALTVEKCAKNNYAIAEELHEILKNLRAD